MNIKARSVTDLINQLASINISVPPIEEGRTTEHCERWNICHLLASIYTVYSPEFPIELIKRERPDFLLTTSRSAIGIEITEAIQSDYARARVLPEAMKDDSVIDPSLFKWGSPKKSLQELREIVSRKELTGPGWEGDEVEVEWSNAIKDTINKKTKKLFSKGFQKFNENWLSIYDNANSFALDINKASAYINEALRDYWSTGCFNVIFVEIGELILKITQTNSMQIHLNDLWKR